MPISFSLEEDQQLIQDTVRSFARGEVRPQLRVWEKAGAVSDEARRKLHELGLGLLDLPEAVGGGGASAVTSALVHEELAAGDAGAAVALWAPHLAASAIALLGEEEQARRLLSRFAASDGASRLGAVAWSERGAAPLAGFSTVATAAAGGYVLSGEKAWVVNGGIADRTVVFAQVGGEAAGWEGVGAFVVDGAAPGLTAGVRHRLLGLETVHVATITLDGCFVAEGDRLRGPSGDGGFAGGLRRWLARWALTTAARQVGLARAAYDLALEYTQERRAFGKVVAHFQSIAFTLAEMAMDVDAARWMVWRAADSLDKNKDSGQVAEAAVHANEAAWRVADNAVQLLGGAGYIQDFPVEKWLRDTKALALFAPGDQLWSLVAAQGDLGTGVELDAGLPSSAIQPVVS